MRWSVEQARAAGIVVPDAPRKTVPVPRARSVSEVEMERQLVASGLTGWVTEHRFCERKWRIDFAFPAERLAVEVDGGVHRIRERFAGDLEKHNALALAGWVLLRFDIRWIATGRALDTITAALAAKGGVSDGR